MAGARMFEGSFPSSREGGVRDFCSIAALFVARFEVATGAPAHACTPQLSLRV